MLQIPSNSYCPGNAVQEDKSKKMSIKPFFLFPGRNVGYHYSLELEAEFFQPIKIEPNTTFQPKPTFFAFAFSNEG